MVFLIEYARSEGRVVDAASQEALRRTHSRYFPVMEWPGTEIEWPEGDLPDQASDPQDA